MFVSTEHHPQLVDPECYRSPERLDDEVARLISAREERVFHFQRYLLKSVPPAPPECSNPRDRKSPARNTERANRRRGGDRRANTKNANSRSRESST